MHPLNVFAGIERVRTYEFKIRLHIITIALLLVVFAHGKKKLLSLLMVIIHVPHQWVYLVICRYFFFLHGGDFFQKFFVHSHIAPYYYSIG